ncbi:glycosyltransferase family 2 protein [Ramlibacter sp.]|uniref:glycosyltransferase n=1 Tax=Ramlibacter sp. TaxID=1917967 RepID=UPI0017F18A17|nr:glycosyltransferase family 2 protein [Ramlibacter sp.]MBA2676660.1 glycosyltransferase family 2 protein [Ramlibacter sp.]
MDTLATAGHPALGSVYASPVSAVLALVLGLIVLVMVAYGVRHTVFTFSRLFGKQRQPYLDIGIAAWPSITVFIAAHNEEKVVAGCMEALLRTDYPRDKLRIVPVNDRSQDDTRAIIDSYVAKHPELFFPFHRTSGKPGKSAALKDALALAEGDIAIIFDADYVPPKGLLRQLVAPFFDPEVGAVMGRVVPANASSNLLTRLLDLERSAGYQVDQQARMNLRGVPQYGGTVGGIRRSAVDAVGGWHDDVLAEDTDITFRLLLGGWKTIYNNRAECYEEVPEEWSVRIRQVRRWAKGHNQVLWRCWRPLLTSPYLQLRERIDGLMLLLVFTVPPLLLVGWVLALVLYYLNGGALVALFIPMLALVAYGALGNFAAFLEIVVAVLLDGHRRRIRLLPINLLCFLVSLFAISRALVESVTDRLLGRELVWHKTLRYRKAALP